MLFYIVFFLFLGYGSADYSFTYNIKYPQQPYMTVKIGNDARDVKVLLDFVRPYSFVFDQSCAIKNCTINRLGYYYNSNITGIPTGQPFKDVYGKYSSFTGQIYNDTITIGDVTVPVKLGVVNGSQFAIKYEYDWDGVIGLGLQDVDTGIVRDIMVQLEEKKITVQQGYHYVNNFNYKEPKKSVGTITFGNSDNLLCGGFQYVNTTSENMWKILTGVNIGNSRLSNKVITFLPGQYSQMPEVIYDIYFGNTTTTQREFYDITFELGGTTYKMTKDDYSWYDYTRNKYDPRLNIAYSEYGYEFGFGSDFLQHYCVSFVAVDNFTYFQIGLAENNNAFTVFGQVTIIILFLIVLQ
ncbi:unnamed protein product [Bursaphelenchus okinawaensis]|uniref:Peptidase A1 domain-containing protein n=1 Tax=Bursaphelenchus okinawaensis TaxID=465554 RepID=A0A811L834_9BILA|nr:unnamed protein product [Bursaphelenchus okinawaensis]CAG9119036.1 unnamed protein product [Bursaphelenchus okinawaensis]